MSMVATFISIERVCHPNEPSVIVTDSKGNPNV